MEAVRFQGSALPRRAQRFHACHAKVRAGPFDSAEVAKKTAAVGTGDRRDAIIMKEASGFTRYHYLVGTRARGAKSGGEYGRLYARFAVIAASAARFSGLHRQFALTARAEEGRDGADSH